jgi:asparagine synthase (glutamine-hydrolysing)
MCGIAGVIGEEAEPLTRRMTAALVHRGPDDDGFFAGAGVALGFRRLSIIDLGGGAQPIANETGDILLICNGEIYNSPALRERLLAAGHRFRTKTDVEVILHLYEDHGEDCVRYLRGMFAFAIWDARTGCLLLGKDHMGQKPLFYWHDGHRFLFASEIQALAASGAVPRALDTDALWHYLSLRSMPDACSLLRGVHKLPAATTLVRSADGSLRLQRYWTPDFRRKLALRDDEAEEALDDCLREAVSTHLLSDVPVGTFLSGGIDSTTIGAMMARHTGASIPAFSIGVEEAGFDELPAAEQVARAEGMTFHGARVRADIATLVPFMVRHLGEPADPYAVGIYLVSRLAARHVKVVLSGDGGDESFGGYDRYVGQRLVDIYRLLPAAMRQTLMPKLLAFVPETFQYKSLAQRLKWLQAMAEVQGGERYARALGVLRFTPEERAELFHPNAVRGLTDPDTLAKVLRYYDASHVESVTDRMLFTDLMTRVPDHNLVMSDRMSMACSLEVRSPFVDPRVVEFAASLPPAMKIRGRQLKFLLRRVAARYLPPDIVRLPKQGFGFPVGLWMQRDLRGLVEARLGDSRLVAAGIFRPEPIARLVSEHMAGRVDHSYRLWLLLNLEIWHELYVEGRSVDAVTADVLDLAARENGRPSS